MKLFYAFILTGFFAIPVRIFSQNETNHWMFGHNGGLDFSSGIPIPESGCVLGQAWGAAAISDPITGNLLMYTDGCNAVYDGNHTAMPNGEGLHGCFGTTQAALIVPKPGSSRLFYVFAADCSIGALGYSYSVVDMTLNGGLGDVIPTQKNISLYSGPTGEQLSAVKHANCVDWWIMTKELSNNVHKAYLLTSVGISGPFTSVVGLTYTDFSGGGQGKFSSDGTKYANCFPSFVQLFDFDNTTGLLSNPITLSNDTIGSFRGVSFSGDNSKVYVGTLEQVASPSVYKIAQYDLSSGDPATIIASNTLIGTLSLTTIPIGSLFQLGKDHKLYIGHEGATSISVINNPNALGTACGFSAEDIAMGNMVPGSLTQFPDSYFNQSSNSCPPEPVEPDIPTEAELIPDIPNVITPNGDGVNDVFKINNLSPSSSLDILNRWGNLVFTTDNYTNDWMGNNSDGTYFYVLRRPNGKAFNGFVQVIAGD